MSRIIYQSDLVDPGKRELAVSEALKIIAEGYPRGENSAKLASKVHRKAYESVESIDPYLDLKVRSNEAAVKVLPEARVFIDSSTDRLEAACLVAIAGNVMDFGIKVGMDGPEEFGREFRTILDKGLQVNEVGRLRHLLEGSKQVHYLLDNCGEVVLDRFLVEEIKAMGVKVVGVVKGEPILTDVTADELVSTGMDKVFDSWTTTGTFAVGLDLDKVPSLRKELEGSDMIISKGMANFEYLSDECLPKVAYLLRTK
ncbi:MAG: ARMT1-like domain-containing protein, partial [Methanomassiliicoccales archaeon]